jgi:transcription factor SFP1
MQESSQTPPPPLYYSPTVSDRGRDSTSENTPVHTPTTGEAPWPTPFGPPKREKDLYFSWHRKPSGAKHQSNPLLGSDWHFTPDSEELLFEDDGDSAFPLFPDSPPRLDSFKMASSALPIDISLPPRLNSQSPRNQTSNLTFALQEAAATGQHASEIPNSGQLVAPESGRLSVSGRHDSISNAFGTSYYGSGARPISVKERQRRESNTGGSFMGGMSWGGISVGSWVRDE